MPPAKRTAPVPAPVTEVVAEETSTTAAPVADSGFVVTIFQTGISLVEETPPVPVPLTGNSNVLGSPKVL